MRKAWRSRSRPRSRIRWPRHSHSRRRKPCMAAIAEGDTIFVFASENEAGQGLVARGVVTSSEAIPKRSGANGRRRASVLPSAAPHWQRGDWVGTSSSGSRTGAMAGLRPSSTSNSIARRRTRSSASRMGRRLFSMGFSKTASHGSNRSLWNPAFESHASETSQPWTPGRVRC